MGQWRGGAAQQSDVEDHDLLEAYLSAFPEERDETCRYVVCLRHKGRDPLKSEREFIELQLLSGVLGMSLWEVLAVIAPPGMYEVYVCFPSDGVY